MVDHPDDLSELLQPRPGSPSPTLREALLHRTERRLAHGRRIRQSLRAAALAGLFGAGGLAGWLARPGVTRTIEQPGPIETVVVPVPMLVAEHSPPPARTPQTAAATELQAEQQDDPAAAAKLYRQAGDAFLLEQDYTNATRCYRLFLTRAGDAALALDSADSWLLVSMKNAAFREKIDVTKNDG